MGRGAYALYFSYNIPFSCANNCYLSRAGAAACATFRDARGRRNKPPRCEKAKSAPRETARRAPCRVRARVIRYRIPAIYAALARLRASLSQPSVPDSHSITGHSHAMSLGSKATRSPVSRASTAASSAALSSRLGSVAARRFSRCQVSLSFGFGFGFTALV